MGKGDKKTRRGKITIKSYGVTRPRKKKASSKVQVTEKPIATESVVEQKKAATKPVKKETKPAKPGKPAKKSE